MHELSENLRVKMASLAIDEALQAEDLSHEEKLVSSDVSWLLVIASLILTMIMYFIP